MICKCIQVESKIFQKISIPVLDEYSPIILIPDVQQTAGSYLSVGELFKSNTGTSLVAESLHQIAVIRYALCRNLLILQQRLIDSSDMPVDTIEFIRSNCMPETVVFVQAYYVMVWICETSETPPKAAAL